MLSPHRVVKVRPNLFHNTNNDFNHLYLGAVTEQQINDQISVMNADYSSTGISWSLAGSEVTVNDDWFNSESSDQLRENNIT